jgi:hypothetical protein
LPQHSRREYYESHRLIARLHVVYRLNVLRHPVVEFHRVGWLAQAQRHIEAFAQARAQPHRLTHGLRAERYGDRPRQQFPHSGSKGARSWALARRHAWTQTTPSDPAAVKNEAPSAAAIATSAGVMLTDVTGYQ